MPQEELKKRNMKTEQVRCISQPCAERLSEDVKKAEKYQTTFLCSGIAHKFRKDIVHGQSIQSRNFPPGVFVILR